jgi:16S rRNA (guanine966-N2)-methyltransferase
LLKIIGGSLRRRRLFTAAGTATRPSASRLREACFAILEARGLVEGARVLDLCAGSGALGLEALSRGAVFCVFVEKDERVLSVLQRNVSNLGLNSQVRLIKGDFRRPLAASFELILADPPYDQGLVGQVLAWAEEQRWLTAGGVLSIEHSLREDAGDWGKLRLLEQRRYGRSRLSFLQPTT